MNAWMSNNRNTIATVIVLGTIVVVAAITWPQWLPPLQQIFQAVQQNDSNSAAVDDQVHDQSDVSYLELSVEARKNIGLTTSTVTFSDYSRTVPVPAVVVQRPGRSHIDITAPMTGVVTKIHAVEGQAIQPGQPLFDLRLTHEDVVSAQAEFLTVIQELDVLQREIQRLQSVGEEFVAGRRIVEKEYERDIAQAKLQAMRQALILHGLSESQVQEIETRRQVIQSIIVSAPPFAEESQHLDAPHLYHVQSTNANRGQNVQAGDLLATLADHCVLYVQGQTFEDDAERLVAAADRGEKLTVTPLVTSDAKTEPLQLEVIYVADHVDRQSRALKFYLLLPNQLQQDERFQKTRFVAWKFRPGQRMQVQVPTADHWVDQIVLPPEAVVIEGPNAYVFEQNGPHFDRIEVHVIYRDANAVVIENDGRLIGSIIATRGAYDMQLALKNQAGDGIQAHHGHTH